MMTRKVQRLYNHSDCKSQNAPTSISDGAPPDPTGGAYSAPPNPLTVFSGPTSRGGEGRGKVGQRRGWEEEEGKNGREGKGGDPHDPSAWGPNVLIRT